MNRDSDSQGGCGKPVLQGFQQQPRSYCLSHAGLTDEHDVLGTGDELQFGEFLDLASRNARLLLEGERLDTADILPAVHTTAPAAAGVTANCEPFLVFRDRFPSLNCECWDQRAFFEVAEK